MKRPNRRASKTKPTKTLFGFPIQLQSTNKVTPLSGFPHNIIITPKFPTIGLVDVIPRF